MTIMRKIPRTKLTAVWLLPLVPLVAFNAAWHMAGAREFIWDFFVEYILFCRDVWRGFKNMPLK